MAGDPVDDGSEGVPAGKGVVAALSLMLLAGGAVVASLPTSVFAFDRAIPLFRVPDAMASAVVVLALLFVLDHRPGSGHRLRERFRDGPARLLLVVGAVYAVLLVVVAVGQTMPVPGPAPRGADLFSGYVAIGSIEHLTAPLSTLAAFVGVVVGAWALDERESDELVVVLPLVAVAFAVPLVFGAVADLLSATANALWSAVVLWIVVRGPTARSIGLGGAASVAAGLGSATGLVPVVAFVAFAYGLGVARSASPPADAGESGNAPEANS